MPRSTSPTQEAARYNDLYARGAGTTQRSQQATSDLAMKRAALDKANASYRCPR